MSSQKVLIILACLVALFLNLISGEVSSPPGFNSDEAAYGYNAYSILQTGRDEHGVFLPIRLKSFGEYKMPIYAYATIPFIVIFDLNEFAVRFVALLTSLFFPLVAFMFAKELTQNKIAVIFSFLIAVSVPLHIVTRHAHEAGLSAFLLTLACVFFTRYFKHYKVRDCLVFFVFLNLSLNTYHASRIFALALLGGFFTWVFWQYFTGKKSIFKKHSLFMTVLLLTIIFNVAVDVLNQPERVKSLFFLNSLGLSAQVEEYRNAGASAILYNKYTLGLKNAFFEYLNHFSPQFLLQKGDSNLRFGMEGISLVTPLEYLLFFFGVYFLFKNKERGRWFILALLLISPISGSFTSIFGSMTRIFFFFIPYLLIVAVGTYYSWQLTQKDTIKQYLFYLTLLGLGFLFWFYAWDIYLNQYPKRHLSLISWQSGYREVLTEISPHLNKVNHVYMTNQLGMPHIFVAFYLKYPPSKYQKQIAPTAPDEYGFSQVKQLDKFIFNFRKASEIDGPAILIGTPSDFKSNHIDYNDKQTIKKAGHEIFVIKYVNFQP